MTMTMTKSLWLDDERLPPDGWDCAKNAPGAIMLLATGKYKRVSLDHDLGACKQCLAQADAGIPTECCHNGTGYDVIKWLEEAAFTDESFVPPFITIHTMNAAMRVKMQRVADKINSMAHPEE